MRKMIAKAQAIMASKKGEGYIDTAVKILIAVVCGALVLGALYFILKETVLTNVNESVSEIMGNEYVPEDPLNLGA